MDRVNEELEQMGAKKALLQLPDGLRNKSHHFKNKIHCDLDIWGGSCYGACDLPASIRDADALIHVGHSEIPNLEPSYPVIYMEGRSTIDLDLPDDIYEGLEGKVVALYSTVQYLDQIYGLEDEFRRRGIEVKYGEGDDRIKYPGQILGCNFSCRTDADEHIYVGSGTFHPVGLSLSLGERVHVFAPGTGELKSTEELVDGLLRRRFAAITLAEEKDKIAILVSEKPGQDRRELVAEIGMECDVVCMEEITPERVDSLGYDVAINTACPRLALDDSIRFKTIMLTPCEYKITKKEVPWDGWRMDEIR